MLDRINNQYLLCHKEWQCRSWARTHETAAVEILWKFTVHVIEKEIMEKEEVQKDNNRKEYRKWSGKEQEEDDKEGVNDSDDNNLR